MKKSLVLLPALALLAGCSGANLASVDVVKKADVPAFRAEGPADAAMTVEEWSDFECPFCGRAQEVVSQLEEKYAGQVKFVFRHLPLESIHPGITEAHIAAECAGEQGKFFEAKKALFADQAQAPDFDFDALAEKLSLDTEKFAECRASDAAREAVYADVTEAEGRGLSSTPTFFLNDEMVRGAQPFAVFDRKISDALAK